MKHTIAAIALLAAAMPALAQTQLDPRTQEHRTQSAELMIDRMIKRMDKLVDACGQPTLQTYLPRYSEYCKEAMIKLYPALNIIREVAAGGDDVKWAMAVEIVHQFERSTEMPLAILERAR